MTRPVGLPGRVIPQAESRAVNPVDRRAPLASTGPWPHPL